MGVGTPEDLIEGVLRGVDIFDCVLPTRLARHHSAMTRFARLNLMNATFAEDERPIDENCGCYTCRTFTRAYLRHLIVAKEMLSATLLSIHNLHTLVQLAKDMRAAISEGACKASPMNIWLTSKFHHRRGTNELFQALIQGIVQGLTEFLPVSSSAHLVIVPYLLNWNLDPQSLHLQRSGAIGHARCCHYLFLEGSGQYHYSHPSGFEGKTTLCDQ